mgnify:CR=1 FL=1
MKSPLKYPLDYYSVSSIDIAETLSPSEVRSEYRRLSRIARQRLGALERAGYGYTGTYKNAAGQFPAISKLDSQKDVERHLSRVARFLSGKLSSVTALRRYERESIETLHERGYDFVNRSNFRQFAEYMDSLKELAKERQYGSVRIAELFGEAKRKGISPDKLKEDFDYWYENAEKLKEQPRIKKEEGKQVTAADYRKAIEKRSKKADGSTSGGGRRKRRNNR